LPVSNISLLTDSWEEIRGFAINIIAIVLGSIGEFAPPQNLPAGSTLMDEAVMISHHHQLDGCNRNRVLLPPLGSRHTALS
jgi:hypothetical protein